MHFYFGLIMKWCLRRHMGSFKMEKYQCHVCACAASTNLAYLKPQWSWLILTKLKYNSRAEMEWKMNHKVLDFTALTIAIIGAVNWGLIGFFSFDLVAFIFGNMSWFSRIVYALVGICGLYLISFYMNTDSPAKE